MATVAFTAFLPEVLPLVPGCAEIIAVNAIRNTVIDFCVQTNIWQETQASVSLSDPDMPYTIQCPLGARVAKIMSVRANGSRVNPVTMDELDLSYFDWQTHEAEKPSHYYMPSPDELRFFPKLTAPNDVVFRVAYAPLRTATGVEGHVYQNWLEELASGALFRLMSSPGQPWANPDAALAHQITYEKGVSEAAAVANKSFSRATSMVQMRRFA